MADTKYSIIADYYLFTADTEHLIDYFEILFYQILYYSRLFSIYGGYLKFHYSGLFSSIIYKHRILFYYFFTTNTKHFIIADYFLFTADTKYSFIADYFFLFIAVTKHLIDYIGFLFYYYL